MGVKYSQLPVGTDVADSDYLAFLDVSDSTLKRCEVSKVGGGKEITQAEYDLLPPAEKVKGTWYITDGEGGGGGGGGTTVISVTEAQYLANKVYYDSLDSFIDIIDADPAIITATEVSFDNTGTGMTATTTQGAITELNSNLPGKLIYENTFASSTYQGVLNAIHSVINANYTPTMKIAWENNYRIAFYDLVSFQFTSDYNFTNTMTGAVSETYITNLWIKNSGSTAMSKKIEANNVVTTTDVSSSAVTNVTIRIYA